MEPQELFQQYNAISVITHNDRRRYAVCTRGELQPGARHPVKSSRKKRANKFTQIA